MGSDDREKRALDLEGNGYWINPRVFMCQDLEEVQAALDWVLQYLGLGVTTGAGYVHSQQDGRRLFHRIHAHHNQDRFRFMVPVRPAFRIQASNPRGEAAEEHDAQGPQLLELVGPLVQVDRCAPVKARGEGRALVLDYRDQNMRYFFVAAVNGLLYADLGRPDGGPSAP